MLSENLSQIALPNVSLLVQNTDQLITQATWHLLQELFLNPIKLLNLNCYIRKRDDLKCAIIYASPTACYFKKKRAISHTTLKKNLEICFIVT